MGIMRSTRARARGKCFERAFSAVAAAADPVGEERIFERHTKRCGAQAQAVSTIKILNGRRCSEGSARSDRQYKAGS